MTSLCLNAAYVLVTPPVEEPIPLRDLDLLKVHLRVDTADDNLLLQEYIVAARVYLEKVVSFMLMRQTWDLCLDFFPSTIEIRKRPVSSIASISYSDADGAAQTLDPATYYIDVNSFFARVVPVQGTWPTTQRRPGAVTVRFSGGADKPEDVDPVFRQALKLHVALLYANREPITAEKIEKVPLAYDALVGTERAIPV